jgi:hypothetical protein
VSRKTYPFSRILIFFEIWAIVFNPEIFPLMSPTTLTRLPPNSQLIRRNPEGLAYDHQICDFQEVFQSSGFRVTVKALNSGIASLRKTAVSENNNTRSIQDTTREAHKRGV